MGRDRAVSRCPPSGAAPPAPTCLGRPRRLPALGSAADRRFCQTNGLAPRSADRPRPLTTVFRLPLGLAFVGSDRRAQFGGFLHLWFRSECPTGLSAIPCLTVPSRRESEQIPSRFVLTANVWPRRTQRPRRGVVEQRVRRTVAERLRRPIEIGFHRCRRSPTLFAHLASPRWDPPDRVPLSRPRGNWMMKDKQAWQEGA